MPRLNQTIRPEYIISQKGQKKAVVLGLKEYAAILDRIEDLEDANDLLKAEREANSFIPYDQFRKTWLTD
ncbi:MAG: hypothetical protein H8E17_12885 [Deltaproteobacteria bacterium]|nr:hypothetical protein [Deltaproteobacteria bacterium]